MRPQFLFSGLWNMMPCIIMLQNRPLSIFCCWLKYLQLLMHQNKTIVLAWPHYKSSNYSTTRYFVVMIWFWKCSHRENFFSVTAYNNENVHFLTNKQTGATIKLCKLLADHQSNWFGPDVFWLLYWLLQLCFQCPSV